MTLIALGFRWCRCIFLIWAATLVALAASVQATLGESHSASQVRLRSIIWGFPAEGKVAISAVSTRKPQAEFASPRELNRSFTVKFSIEVKDCPADRVVLNIPAVLQVRVRQHDSKERARQNYPAYRMADGSVPVLEATVTVHSEEHPDWQSMAIGVPLAMLSDPKGKHEVVLDFTGPDWKLYVDGRLLDNDFPFGYPRWPAAGDWSIDPEFVKDAELFMPGLAVKGQPAGQQPIADSIQYWTPSGHNNWVGDVETCFFQGRYHVFYLYDRRHHQSKFGCGAHYFEHLSTADFKTWTEHEAATPLEEQWECIGTGVPFALGGRLYLSYGMHTTRVYPQEKTTLPGQWEYLKTNGFTGSFNRATTPGFPAGATYAVSTDGVSRFRKSWVMFHPCENPSVFTTPEGKLRLLANYRSSGTWESDSVDGGWRCINPTFPPGGDCTICFRWGRFDYVIGGFTGLWAKPAEAPDTAYEDVVRKGLDFYDGSNVPAVTDIGDGRFLMAGWVPIRGWGGVLLIRELIQFPDGRIGCKWMDEVTPRPAKSENLDLGEAGALQAPSHSFALEFTVHPKEVGKGKFGLSFLPADDKEAGCELQIDVTGRRAQLATAAQSGFAPVVKSLREGAAPQQAGDYAVENLLGVGGPFRVRVVVKHEDKLGGSLIDVEIAGVRTLISYRAELEVARLGFQPVEVGLEGGKLGSL